MELHMILCLVLGAVVLHSTQPAEGKQKTALECTEENAAKLLLGLLRKQSTIDKETKNQQALLGFLKTQVQKDANGDEEPMQQDEEVPSPPELNDKRSVASREAKLLRAWFGEKKATRWQMVSLWRRRPWLRLPNQRCYRQHCESKKDCCRHHNICDISAKVCYDCWYGYPCRSSADCCMRYPRCISSSLGKQGRCSN